VALIHDQDVIEEFASDGADDSFAVGVHPGRPWRAGDGAQFVGLEHGVERVAVLGVAVAEQESQGLDAGAEVCGEGSSLLRCPCLGRMGGDAGDVQAPGAVFEEGQCVEACAERGVEVEEVRRDDALGLGGEEFPPGEAGAAWCRVDARVVQDLPDRRRSDPVAKSYQFTVDAAVSLPGVLSGESYYERRVAARIGGRPMRRCAV
jgi:hypothetical protein